jgi:predicted transcriptional regulator
MPTTLKLPDELKTRVTAAAREEGKSPHAFMLEAIERETTLAERRKRFLQAAREARAEVRKTGRVHDAEDVHAFLQARLKGQGGRRPKAKSWRG